MHSTKIAVSICGKIFVAPALGDFSLGENAEVHIESQRILYFEKDRDL